MAAKFRRAEMSFSTQDELDQFKKICDAMNMSGSDVLRNAMNIAYQCGWPVPLWRQPATAIKEESVIRRASRKAKKVAV